MKKSSFIAYTMALVVVLALLMSMLVGCNNIGNLLDNKGGDDSGSGAAPTNKIEKVAYAFAGVERSLSNQKAATTSASTGGVWSMLWGNVATAAADTYDNGTALAAIYDMCNNNTQVASPQFKYDEPPMIQFRYVKALYDKVGASYEFGRVYTDTLRGTINYDFATGQKTTEQNYVADALIDIDIDDNDLITVHLGMKLSFTNGNDTHEQRFYVEMVLDYDMTKSEPNYDFSLKYEDDCSRYLLAAERTNTYEYDYVNAVDGSINEWRKFYVDSAERLLKDAEHPTFASYVNSVDFSCRARAYKKGTMYMTNHTDRHDNQVDAELRNRVATTLFNDFGLNATDINSAAYFAKTGTPNSAITSTFEDFARIFGGDVIGDIVHSAADHGESNGGQTGGDNSGNTNEDGNDTPAQDGDVKGWDALRINRAAGIELPVPQAPATSQVTTIEEFESGVTVIMSNFMRDYVNKYISELTRIGFAPDANSGMYKLSPAGADYNMMASIENRDDDAVLTVYKTDAEYVKPGEGGQGEGGQGEGGQGEGGQSGGNEQGKDPNEGQGGESGGQGGEVVSTVDVRILVFDAEGTMLGEHPRTCVVGSELDANEFGEAEFVQEDLMTTIGIIYNVTAETRTVYVKLRSNLGSAEYTFTLYNVNDDGTKTVAVQATVQSGSTLLHTAYSYLMYTDEQLTKPLAPNESTIVKQDLTLYRKTPGVHYVYIPVTYYINGVDVTAKEYTKNFIRVEEDKLYYTTIELVSAPFNSGTLYWDSERSTTVFENGAYRAFNAANEDTPMYAFYDGDIYGTMEFWAGDKLLVTTAFYINDSDETIQSAYDWGYNIQAIGKFTRNGKHAQARVEQYTKLYRQTTVYCANGHAVGSEYTYYGTGVYFFSDETTGYYTDVTCTTPYIRAFGEVDGDFVVYAKAR